jgi:hypothetical protein
VWSSGGQPHRVVVASADGFVIAADEIRRQAIEPAISSTYGTFGLQACGRYRP